MLNDGCIVLVMKEDGKLKEDEAGCYVLEREKTSKEDCNSTSLCLCMTG